MALPEWNELSPLVRRSPKKIYNVLKDAIDELSNEEEEDPQPPATYSITVAVKDEEETGIGSVSVKLTDKTNSSAIFTGTTGSAGGCTISNVPAGTYIVTATKEGYDDYTGSEDFVVDGAETLNITMTETEDPEGNE